MKDLLEYLSDNKISHKEIDETFLFINEEKHKLLIPDDGIMMDDDFDLVGMEEEGVKYIYSFGGQWYFSSSITKPDMSELKYIGESTSKIPTNTFLGVHGAYEMLNGSRLYEEIGRASCRERV